MIGANAGGGLVEPRLVKVRAGERGSGWAVGTRGVLTARHVVAAVLDERVDRCLAVPDPAPGAAVFDCAVIWQDAGRDLALLAVDQKQAAAWVLAVGPGLGAPLAEPGTGGLPAEAVGYPDAAVEQDFPHPELVLGWLKPAGGAISGQMPFDVDGSVPDGFLLWQGMSGAAVRDRSDGRLLGVVVRVDEDRQQRRLYVASLPDPAVDTAFSAALAEVGAESVLEAASAPTVRRLLAAWDQRGRPPAVGQVTQLAVFGARKARTDIDTHGDPYYPYVDRQLDRAVAQALDRRALGTERRVLLLVGEAMTGKSRTGAHALQSHPALSARPLLVPQPGADLRQVIELAPAGGAVLWLDDLNTFAAGLSPGAVRYWLSRPGVVVVATLRSDLLSGLQGDPNLRPAWTLIDDDSLVEQFLLPAEWSAADQQALAGAEESIRHKVADGIPLGEVLAAAQELRDRLAVASPLQQALVFTVIDWSRTGLTVRLPDAQAEALWIGHLSRKDAAVFQNQSRGKRHQDFLRAVGWACEAIPGTAAMLVTRNDDGLLAEDYLVAQRAAAQPAIPHPIWQAALNQAQAAGTPATIAALAYNAGTAEVFDIARAAWEPLAAGNTEEAPMASRNLGMVLNNMGDLDGARTAYQRAIDSHDPMAIPGASYSLGVLLEEHGDVPGAKAAYQIAIDSGVPTAASNLGSVLEGLKYAGVAAFNLGVLLAGQGDMPGAKAAYQIAIDNGHVEYAPMAAFNLGLLLAEQGDVPGAKAAYQVAVDSGHAEQAPVAAVNLGLLLAEQGDVPGAKAAYQVAVDSGHAEQAPVAAVNVGLLLKGQDPAGAKAAYQVAVDSGHTEAAPLAAVNLGLLLAEQGDVPGAKAAFQVAVDSGHAEAAPLAAVVVGLLLAGQGDVPGAKAAFQVAVDSGHAEQAPVAATSLGLLLAEQGDVPGAKAAFQVAVDSGRAEQAWAAAVNAGRLLAEQGDVPGAKAAYQIVIDSGHAEYAPAAAGNLGLLLEGRDPAGARAAYQVAIDSGHAKYAPAAAGNLGLLLEGQDPAGARAAYQVAIDSGHAEYAPKAAVNLGLLLAEQGDVPGARAAYQVVIDSGHAEYAPMAAVNLGVLLAEQGDVPGAKAAYQVAIDSGHAEYALAAAGNLGRLLAEQGDVPGAKAAYQVVIDSGHAEQAPAAAVNLGRLLAEQGDVPGAKAAYQVAVDSGHAEYAPWADFFLGEQCTGEDLHARRLHREHAAASGDADLLLSLAELYAVEGDVSSAKRLLNQASSAGRDHADNYLALLESHRSGLVSPPTIAAISATAEAGDTDSMNFLGWHARSQGRREEAHSWWTRSAAHGDVIAALLIAQADRND